MQRRHFLRFTSAGSLLPAIGLPLIGSGQTPAGDSKTLVHFNGDGLILSPADYAQLLGKLTANDGLVADNYSLGGCVEDLEKRFAELLGKEAAVFMPTGTLANHLAIRTLAGPNHRVIVQHESHVYNDTGDGAQVLSNLNLVPLGQGKAGFTAEEVKEVIQRTAGGRVAARIGAISIESPVRRKLGQVFDFEEMKKIAILARDNKISMHLDGARLFLATPYTGVPVLDYTALFDTVYVSLYKYFNAASGAILAGPKTLIEPMYHARRMFGSGIQQAWPFAAVANHYAHGFEDRFSKAASIANDLLTRLTSDSPIEVRRIPFGTNIFKLAGKGIGTKQFTENLKSRGILMRAGNPSGNELICTVNESLIQTTAADLAAKIIGSTT